MMGVAKVKINTRILELHLFRDIASLVKIIEIKRTSANTYELLISSSILDGGLPEAPVNASVIYERHLGGYVTARLVQDAPAKLTSCDMQDIEQLADKLTKAQFGGMMPKEMVSSDKARYLGGLILSLLKRNEYLEKKVGGGVNDE